MANLGALPRVRVPGISLGLFVSLVVLSSEAGNADANRQVTEIADGVYVIQHRTEPFEGGNTTVIVGDDGVLVIDTCFLPYAASEDISTIQSLTDKPVRFVVNTHWHNDHVMGNAQYKSAYPTAIFVAHRETRRDMDLNIPNAAKRSLPGYQALVAETTDEELQSRLRAAVADYTNHVYQAPTLVFEKALTFELGNREVRLLHLGRGNTNGDTVAYLPDERIVATGDLLVNPLPYVYDGYPTEWIHTLDKLAALDADVFIPGHGDIQRDRAYLQLVRDLFHEAIRQVDSRLYVIGPAEFRSFSDIEDHVDLASFRERFAEYGVDEQSFDQAALQLSKLVFKEASLR